MRGRTVSGLGRLVQRLLESTDGLIQRLGPVREQLSSLPLSEESVQGAHRSGVVDAICGAVADLLVDVSSIPHGTLIYGFSHTGITSRERGPGCRRLPPLRVDHEFGVAATDEPLRDVEVAICVHGE